MHKIFLENILIRDEVFYFFSNLRIFSRKFFAQKGGGEEAVHKSFLENILIRDEVFYFLVILGYFRGNFLHRREEGKRLCIKVSSKIS